jgi:hypothetical protein
VLAKVISRRREIIVGLLRGAGQRVGIAAELISFFWNHKRWWAVPILITLFLLGMLLVLAQSSAIAPFIYTLF